jgi:plastocyanin
MRSGFFLAIAVLLAACAKQEPAPPAEEYFQPDPASAATVTGKAVFEGKAPRARRISMEAEADCAKLHAKPVYDERLVVAKDGGLANVFVYVKSGLEGKRFAPAGQAVVLEQRGCQFLPRIVPVRAGQTLAVKNLDPVSHNVHPMPAENRDWNQHQTPGAPDIERRFARPEVMIPVKCNIHAWMRAYIGVLDHPYAQVTGALGEFELTGLPPGRYTIAAWHEALGESVQTIELAPKARETLRFMFR